MSRKIDMNKISKADHEYLAQRALLPTDVMSVADQREMLDAAQYHTPLVQLANTGDVNLGLLTLEELEVELEKRREVQDGVDTVALMRPEGVEGALAPVEAEEVKPYTEWKKVDLITEIQARNEDLPDDEQMVIGGNIAELSARLTANDEE